MSDLISRQAAIDALGERPMVWVESDYELGARNQYDADVLALETVPSAQPSSSCGHEKDAQSERKRGTWIIKDNPGTGWYRVTCSECGEDVTSTAPCIGFYPNAKVTWDYCPNCGADMRGEQDE